MYVVPNQLEINNKFTDRSQKLLDSWTNKEQVDYSFHNDFWHIYFNFIANYVKQAEHSENKTFALKFWLWTFPGYMVVTQLIIIYHEYNRY